MNLEQHILQELAAAAPGDRAVTIGDLARQFGASREIVTASARRLIDNGQAVSDSGDLPLRGLRAVSATAPSA